MTKRPVVPKMRGVENLLTMNVATQNEAQPTNLMELGEIIDRPMDTRPLNSAHVEALVESIAALGLIQPIAVDSKGQLLAGGHRLAAITQLRSTNAKAFTEHFGDGIPVRRYDFEAATDPDLALAIEATENEKRRDYTPAEVRELADRLKDAGYQYQKGGQRKGAKGVAPTLAVIVGKSQRTIERYLSPPDKLTDPTDVGFIQQIPSAVRSLKKILNCSDVPEDVANDVKKLLKKLDR
jgi:ParB family transcriptional regulator, chromosome partitioning protein